MDRIQKLKQMLESDPDDAFCLYSLAQEHGKLGENDTAIEYYNRALAQDPDYLYAYFHKAKCLEEADQYEEARRTLEVGLDRARDAGDEKAMSEMHIYLDEMSDER